MANEPSADDVRKEVLTQVKIFAGQNGSDGFSRSAIIERTSEKLGQRYNVIVVRRIMDAWDDLFRAGVIGHGMDMANLGENWSHLTEFGVEAVKDLDRDPSNPAAFFSRVAPYMKDSPIASSYLDEALATYNKGAFKSSAVMLGCAAEALHLALRDELVAKISLTGKPSPKLTTWMISQVLREMENILAARVGDMDRGLRERFESYWPAWTGLFRMTRNDAGHPKSIEPITRDAMHAALLLFPEQARLSFDLSAWVASSF